MQTAQFASVYGPVKSWRFGRSLGIDPIGAISTCSFNCVYCQLGEMQQQNADRQVFVSTKRIRQDLLCFQPWNIDVVTLSGSGEPTLARNLGEIIAMAKILTEKPVGVLTNGSLLENPLVCAELAIADFVAIKIDAVSEQQFQSINRPIKRLTLDRIWSGLTQFRHRYRGKLAIQTMLLAPWHEQDQINYITHLQALCPQEVQLNTPTRPKPLEHQLDARGNHELLQPYPVRSLKAVSEEVLEQFRDRIQAVLDVPVRYPALTH
ncbi:MAG: radical SAM protein [Leptolyngbya sp. Prado105]|jgi:wyosine [tRNA(Phe)-imidazoG37] synthetase (radical SAM superfamily)|nr:radical SAM protein [Leptolyngbya sp. Prado105]